MRLHWQWQRSLLIKAHCVHDWQWHPRWQPARHSKARSGCQWPAAVNFKATRKSTLRRLGTPSRRHCWVLASTHDTARMLYSLRLRLRGADNHDSMILCRRSGARRGRVPAGTQAATVAQRTCQRVYIPRYSAVKVLRNCRLGRNSCRYTVYVSSHPRSPNRDSTP